MIKRLLNKMIFRKNFENKEDYEQAVKLMAGECLHTGMISLLVIILFEVIIIAIWAVSGNDFGNRISAMYFVSYVLLLAISIIIFLLLFHAVKKQKNIEKKVVFSSYFYSMILLLWALMITYLDISKSGYFTSLVYMTIIVIIPVSTFIQPFYYLLLNTIGSIFVISMLFTYCDMSINRGNFINFLVFAIISMIAGCAYSLVRMKSYVNRVKLEQINDKMQHASEHDYLSGLYNRQKLGLVSVDIWKQCVKKQAQLSCVLCDLDNFKKFNDVYGHDCGDDCIRLVAELFHEVLDGTGAYYFRYGGEEFLLLFPEYSYEDTYHAMEHIQEKLRSARLKNVDAECKVTMSVGIYTGVPDEAHVINQYFTKADGYMYEAKTSGKNCIRGNEELA